MKLMMMLAFLGMTTAFAADVYNVDAVKSLVKWKASKVTGTHYGKINFESGTLDVEGTDVKSASFVVDMNSMTCDDLTGEYHDKLINHLKDDDFFGVSKFKNSTLKIEKVTKGKNGENTYAGTLTIKGKSNPVTFKGSFAIVDGVLKSEGKLSFDRTTYDIKYGSGKFFQNLGDKMINDVVDLTYVVEAKK